MKAARELIKGYEDQIAASDQAIDLAKKEIESLKQLSALQTDRAKELESAIAAEQAAKATLIQLKQEQEQRIATLEKKLSHSRKFILVAGAVAIVGILAAIYK